MYSGKDIRTGKEVALKVARRSRCDSDLQHEYQIYKDIAGGPGIPRVFWCGVIDCVRAEKGQKECGGFPDTLGWSRNDFGGISDRLAERTWLQLVCCAPELRCVLISGQEEARGDRRTKGTCREDRRVTKFDIQAKEYMQRDSTYI